MDKVEAYSEIASDGAIDVELEIPADVMNEISAGVPRNIKEGVDVLVDDFAAAQTVAERAEIAVKMSKATGILLEELTDLVQTGINDGVRRIALRTFLAGAWYLNEDKLLAELVRESLEKACGKPLSESPDRIVNILVE